MMRSVYVAWLFALLVMFQADASLSLHADEEAAVDAVSDEAAGKDGGEKAEGDEADDGWANEQDANKEIQKLIRTTKFEEANELLKKAKAKWPNSIPLRGTQLNLIMTLANEDLPTAKQRFESVLSEAEKEPNSSLSRRYAFMMVPSFAMTLARAGEVEEALALLDRIEKDDSAEMSASGGRNLSLRATILMQAGRNDEATAMFNSAFDQHLKQDEEAEIEDGDLISLVAITETATRLLSEPSDELAGKIAKVNELITAKVDSDEATLQLLSAFVRLKTTTAMNLADQNPAAAEQTLTDLKAKLQEFETDIEAEQKQLDRMGAQIESSLSRIASLKARFELIGKPAPEINAEHFVNGELVTLADLKGKVVILDFWAVWCGPCIATFPHLRHLHEAHAKDGLVILGVTRPYGFSWDKENATMVPNAEATIEDELEMLEQFRVHHELPYAFAVTAKEGDTAKKYAVTGIPQLVVIDQQGDVQLIEVGAGEKTAKSVDAMVEKLLGKPQS